MPEHVHAILWFPQPGCLSSCLQHWKGRSSTQIKSAFRSSSFAESFLATDPIWQRRFYSFEIESRFKLEEKLTYMHLNPVRAGLVDRAVDWKWSSARWYEQRRSVGVPIQWVD